MKNNQCRVVEKKIDTFLIYDKNYLSENKTMGDVLGQHESCHQVCHVTCLPTVRPQGEGRQWPLPVEKKNHQC